MKLLSFKQFYLLQESFESMLYSILILNLLFHKDMYYYVYHKIETLFPIYHNDIKSLRKCASIIQQVKINMTMNKSFPAYEDYALTILNKLFCSRNDRNEMVDFLNHNITELLTEHNIKILYDKFHSHFGK